MLPWPVLETGAFDALVMVTDAASAGAETTRSPAQNPAEAEETRKLASDAMMCRACSTWRACFIFMYMNMHACTLPWRRTIDPDTPGASSLRCYAETTERLGRVRAKCLGDCHARPVHAPVPRDHEASTRHSDVACPPERASGGRWAACANR